MKLKKGPEKGKNIDATNNQIIKIINDRNDKKKKYINQKLIFKRK